MGAIGQKTSIGAAGAGAQSAAAFDFVETQLLAAGFTVIRYLGNHNSGDIREAIYRWPSLDGDQNSFADSLYMSNRNGGNNLYAHAMYDWDIQQNIALIYTTLLGSQGAWTGGTWPTTGTPFTGAVGSAASTTISIAFTGAIVDPFRVMVSEYGLTIEKNLSGAATLASIKRCCFNPQRHVREMELAGVATGGAPGWPITFAAPTGAQHLTVNIEGVTFNITFPTATALSAYRVAQHITMTLGGFGEAYVRTPSAGNDQIIIRIPPERAPSGNYSTTQPQISMTYQDPQVIAAGLSFEIYNGSVTAIVTGAGGTIQRNGSQWPTDSGGVHIGATIYNHTRSNSCLVTGFSTTTTTHDTMVCDTIPGTWLPADSIEVLPGPNNHQHGCGRHGGHYQAFLDSDPTANITAGGDRVVVLNDELGEAQGHYEVGQRLQIVNNHFVRELTLTPVSGTFIRGEIVEVTTGTSDGTRGVVRYISGNDMLVDCIRGPADVGYGAAVPWTATDTITGQTSGATATIAIGAAPLGLGWFQIVEILAIGQKDPANGDYRTTLTLDLDAVTVQPGATFGPGACVGLAPKERVALSITLPSATTTMNHLPIVEPTGTFVTNWDQNRNENELAAGQRTIHEPDYETHSLQVANMGESNQTITFMGAEFFGAMPHVKSVSSRQLYAALANTDQFAEDGDVNRLWALVAKTSTAAAGASSLDSVTHNPMIGPSTSAII